MTKKSLWEDESARVPFAVIGIFLILISTVVSINLNKLDVEMAKTMSSNVEVTAADTALQYARADLARAINYAGMEALKTLGENHVELLDASSVGKEYKTSDNPDEFNRNWGKAMINDTLRQFIEANFMYDTYVYNGYSVNVQPPEHWNKITIEPVMMKLKERPSLPIDSLNPGKNQYEKGYESYWKVNVPLVITIKDLKSNTIVMNEPVRIETLITSRYPLMRELVDEYSQRLNGTNATMVETTAFAMAYTWAGGYLQYYKQKPANIVNNTYLGLIANGALLLDQGFVFNSVDPMSIVDFAIQTVQRVSGKQLTKEYKDVKLDDGKLNVDPEEDAFNSTGDHDEAKRQYENASRFDFNATPITDYLDNKSMPSGSNVSAMIKAIIPKVYNATFATNVARITKETEGLHNGYTDVDGGHEDWKNIEPVTEQIGTVPRDVDIQGTLYGEIWNVTRQRDHRWGQYYTVYYTCTKTRTYQYTDAEGNIQTGIEEYQDTCSRTETNWMTATDTRVDTVTLKLKATENSKTDVYLNYSKKWLSSKNDVLNAFSKRNVQYTQLREDSGLEPAYLLYRTIFDSNIQNYIKTLDLSGDKDVKSYTVPELTEPDWLQGEAHNAVDNISQQIKNDIHLDPNINYVSFPVPSDLMNATREDLLKKINYNATRYIKREGYTIGTNYNSTSAKVISVVREWYVDEVRHQIETKFRSSSDEINKNFSETFKDNADNVKNANKNATKLLSQGMNLPIGFRMIAYHVDGNGDEYPNSNLSAWNESVTLSINQEPNFLDESTPIKTINNEELYTLKVRNINLLGPTGFYILPSMNPWITTVNGWLIDVEGEFVRFEVHDIDNEVHPDSIFGHGSQAYVRKESIVQDSNKIPIGQNLPIRFKFTTGTFIAVPPGKLTGVGDKEGGYSEESPGWVNNKRR